MATVSGTSAVNDHNKKKEGRRGKKCPSNRRGGWISWGTRMKMATRGPRPVERRHVCRIWSQEGCAPIQSKKRRKKRDEKTQQKSREQLLPQISWSGQNAYPVRRNPEREQKANKKSYEERTRRTILHADWENKRVQGDTICEKSLTKEIRRDKKNVGREL